MNAELNPNYVPGNYRYALFLTAMGRFEEALKRMKLALQLDPMAPVANAYQGWILYFPRRYDEAIDQLRNLFLEIEPNFPLGRYFLGLAYMQKGRYEDAIAELQMARESTGLHPMAIAVISHAHSRAGRKAEARKWLHDLKETAKRRYVSAYYIARAHLGLGEKDRALEWLGKAYEERSGWLVNLKIDPLLDRFRSDKRFQDRVRRVGLPT